jgi:hypothetical protein
MSFMMGGPGTRIITMNSAIGFQKKHHERLRYSGGLGDLMTMVEPSIAQATQALSASADQPVIASDCYGHVMAMKKLGDVGCLDGCLDGCSMD